MCRYLLSLYIKRIISRYIESNGKANRYSSHLQDHSPPPYYTTRQWGIFLNFGRLFSQIIHPIHSANHLLGGLRPPSSDILISTPESASDPRVGGIGREKFDGRRCSRIGGSMRRGCSVAAGSGGRMSVVLLPLPPPLLLLLASLLLLLLSWWWCG